MPGVPVHLDRSPFNARLLLWGRAADGWWGLVEWAQTVRTAIRLESMQFAAWVPGTALSRPNWSAAPGAAPPRIALPGSQPDWPAPAGWTGWFAGVWAGGTPAAPPGATIVTGPAWRNR